MPPSGFDRLARSYRWLEYATFGPALQQCRLARLPRMLTARHALVLGDGDGRFTAALLAANPHVRVVAVDASPAMLRLLTLRATRLHAAARLTTVTADAVTLIEPASEPSRTPALLAPPGGFDLVATHFFLDCLSSAQVLRLALAVRHLLAPEALWVISEFATPTPWAHALVRLLYLGFRLLTGLRTRQLPAWQQALASAGFHCQSIQGTLAGLLTSSVWSLHSHPPSRDDLSPPLPS